jgi:hypothetical protein
MKDKILLIRTGGTFDSEPYADPSKPPVNVTTRKGKDSFIASTVASFSMHDDVVIDVWKPEKEKRFVKDSKGFSIDDMIALAHKIKESEYHYIVITHGTDAMAKNAKNLQHALTGSDKVVAMVGSMVPLSMHKKKTPQGQAIVSDGVETLEFTLKHIRDKSQGLYVAGRDAETRKLKFFNPQHVQKNWELSRKDLQFTLGRGM